MASCKTLCKSKPQCTHIALESSTCYEYGYTGADISDYSDVETLARYPSCGERSTCLNLTIENFHYLSGEYCPYGESAFADGQVFLKLGRTEPDSFWLVQNDDSLAACDGKAWVLRVTAPDLDFWNASSNHVEHRGRIAACFNKADLVTAVHSSSPANLLDMVIVETGASPTANVALVMPSCGTPNVTMAEGVQTSEAGSETTLGSGLLILDDPATSQIVEDYWLHPCQCVPPDWDGAPVTPEAIADIPPDSNNQFLAPPFQIVAGAFVCEQEFLLKIHHTGAASRTDLDEGSCRTLCAEAFSCSFFWVGSVGASRQCWTYSNCQTLYRRVGLEGTLMAWPKYTHVCRIVDAQQCWHVTKRREFLKASTKSSVRPLPRCLYQSLFEQCDQKLMLGGTSVDQCGECKFAAVPFKDSGAPRVTTETYIPPICEPCPDFGIPDNELSVLPFNDSTPSLFDNTTENSHVFFNSGKDWVTNLTRLPWLYGSNCYYIKGEKRALFLTENEVHMTIQVPWNAVVYLAFYDEDASALYGLPHWEDSEKWQYFINTSNFETDKAWDAMWFFRYLEAGEELKLYGNDHPCQDDPGTCNNLWPFLPFVCPHVDKPIATTEMYVDCFDNFSQNEVNLCINNNSVSVLPFNDSTPSLFDNTTENSRVFFNSGKDWVTNLTRLPWLYGSNCYYIKGEKRALFLTENEVHMTIQVPWNAVVYLAFYDEDASALYGLPHWEDSEKWQYFINTSNFETDKAWDAMWFLRYLEAGEELKLYGNDHPCQDEPGTCNNLWPYLPFVCPSDAAVSSLPKRNMPSEFQHGTAVVATCWDERYSATSNSTSEIRCVAGAWINSNGGRGLGNFECLSLHDRGRCPMRPSHSHRLLILHSPA